MELLREFGELNKNDVALAGGKGASLGEMFQAGIPVPPGFVILSNAFERFIEETGLAAEIDSELHKVDHKEVHTVEKASETIQALILEQEMPADLSEKIMKEFEKLDTEFVAVRSSATAEDSSSAAWAGQLDSYLNTTKKELLDKVRHCWASLFTPRAIFYRFEKKLHKEKISVAVVVQKMVNSDISGIGFSVHPVTQDYNQLIIEAGLGLGEAIVSGQITPDSYVVEKDRWELLEKHVSEQTKKIVRKKDGGNEWVDAGERGKEQVIPDGRVIELAKLIVKIEEHYGFPVDIEFAREDGKFFIVQSRPITTLTEPVKKKSKNDLKRPGINPDNYVKHGKWSNGTYVNAFFMETEEKEYYQRELGLDYEIRNIVDIDDTFYQAKKSYNEFVDMVKKDVPGFMRKWNKGCNKNIESLKEYVDGREGIDYPRLSDKELLKGFDEFQKEMRGLFVFLFSYVPFSRTLEPYIVENVPDLDFGEIRPLHHLSSEKLKDALARGKNLDEIEEEFSWFGLNLLRGKPLTKQGLKEIRKDAKKAPEIKVSENPLLKELQFTMWLKFERIDAANYALYHMSPMFHEIMKRIGLERKHWEVLMPEEIRCALASGNIPDNLEDRFKYRGAVKQDGKVRNLDKEEWKRYKDIFTPKAEDVSVLKGKPVCGGKVRGRVTVVPKPDDITKVKEGEILVTPETIVEQEPYLHKTIGMIIELPGMLTHSSIFAREFKIPTIVGVENATHILNDGQEVELDADKGTVKILGKKSSGYTFLWGDWQPAYTLEWNAKAISEHDSHEWNDIENIIEVSKNMQIICYHSNKDIQKDIERGKLHLDKDYQEEFARRLEGDYENHWDYFENLRKAEFSELSDEELFEHFEKAMDNCARIIGYFRATQQEGTEKLIDEIKKNYNNKEVSVLLMSPEKDLAVQEQEDWQRLVQEGYSEDKMLKHAEKYPWAVMSHFTYEDVVETLKQRYEYDKENLKPKNYDREKEELKKKQEKILKEKPAGKDFVRYAQRLNLSRMQVKSCWAGTDFYVIPLIAEIARRTGENVEDIFKFYLVYEIKELLEGKKLSMEEKEKRRKAFVFLWKNSKREFFSGEEAEKVARDELKELYELEERDEIKGIPANPGKASGKARILHANNLEETRFLRKDFKQGDILITEMTQPNVMDIASRAGAIVTDEGGMLSHAAIISRELGIPCIVGTHFATKLISDGQRIQVDANEGIVKKLK